MTTSFGGTSRGHPPRLPERPGCTDDEQRGLDQRGSGPAARSAVVPENCPTHTLNSADRRCRRGAPTRRPTAGPGRAPGARVTSTTATSATTIPATAAGCGTPSSSEPGRHGDDAPTARRWSAPRRPSGPTASPRYRLVIPTSAAERRRRGPAEVRIGTGNGSPRSDGERERRERADGLGHARRRRAPGRDGSPARRRSRRCPSSARRARPRTTTATSGRELKQARAPPAATWPSTAVGPSSDDDLVGERVVAVRRREVDHLEVAPRPRGAAPARAGARSSSRVTNGSSRTSGGRRSPVTSRTSPSRAAR